MMFRYHGVESLPCNRRRLGWVAPAAANSAATRFVRVGEVTAAHQVGDVRGMHADFPATSLTVTSGRGLFSLCMLWILGLVVLTMCAQPILPYDLGVFWLVS